MLVLNANLKATTLAAHHQLSFEQQVCTWLKSYQLTLIVVNAVLKAMIGRGLSLAGNAA